MAPDLDDKIFLIKDQNDNIMGYKTFQGKIADVTEDVYCSKRVFC
jgi:hypothetical protein